MTMTPLKKTSDNSNKATLENAIPQAIPLVVGAEAIGHVFRSVSMSLPPLLSRERLIESPNTNMKALKKSKSSPVAMLHKQKNPPVDHWVWKVKVTILTPIPMYHPLERTALKLDNLTLQTVTARISDFMRVNSIKCSYHHDAARVDCLTETLVKFAIHLWRGQGLLGTTETETSQIIVEVQRRQGCPIEMQNIRHYLYHAIQTGDAGIPRDTKIYKFRASGRCDLIQQVVEHQYQHQQGHSNATNNVFPDALEICKDLLDSDYIDQHRLGLESLCCLTDPTKVRSQDSDRISRTIIYGESDGDKSLQDNFETYFCGVELPMGNDSDDNSGYDSEEDGKALAYEQGNYFGAMHILSLRVLSHSLESIAWQKEKGAASMSLAPFNLTSLFWGTVLQALYYNLEVAAHRPLEASLSAKCLRLLQSLEPQLTANGNMHLLSSLQSANQYGKEHSLSLEQESEQLMGRIEFAF
jgi:hypothetical protein